MPAILFGVICFLILVIPLLMRGRRREKQKRASKGPIGRTLSVIMVLMGSLTLMPVHAGAQALDQDWHPSIASCDTGTITTPWAVNDPTATFTITDRGSQNLVPGGGVCTLDTGGSAKISVFSPIKLDTNLGIIPPSIETVLEDVYRLRWTVAPGEKLKGLRIQYKRYSKFKASDPSAPTIRIEGNTFFSETGHNITPAFWNYWGEHGGLEINGLPLTDDFWEILENGEFTRVQYFERARFEYHQDNPSNQRILLGLFGSDINGGIDPPAVKQRDDEIRCVFYDESHHNTCGRFLTYWEANGGLAQFGYPIGEQKEQELGGKTYTVQYFERARFEYHPENPEPYTILLGQFGRQVLAARLQK